MTPDSHRVRLVEAELLEICGLEARRVERGASRLLQEWRLRAWE